MDQENQPPPNEFHYVTFRKKAGHNEDFSYMDNSHETIKSVTPKRPFISYDYVLSNTSPSSSNCSHQTAVIPHESQGSSSFTTEEKQVPLTCAFVISPPTKHVYSSILDDDNGYVPAYINQKFKHPLPYSIHNASNQRTMKIIQKPNSTTQMKTSTSSHSIASIAAANEYQGSSFQPSLRMRVPVNSSSTNTIEKQEYAFTILLNSLFTPDEFVNVQQSTFQAQTKEQMPYKALAETNRWYSLRDRARNLYETEIKPVATKISCDIDQSRINPKSDLNFAARTVNRQALLNFISSYNRTWFRLAMEILFPIDIDSNQPMKTYIDQYLIQTTTLSITKAVSPLIRLTLKNLIIIVVFLERAKLKHLIEYDPCLYVKESKFKSTKDTLDVISRDFISTDTNLLRRLKLAGFEPQYKQTSLDEYNYSISEKQLFDDLKDGIRLSRCAYVLLSSNTNPFSFTDLSSRLKCPVVNLVHKLLNIDQAFDLFQKYGHVNLSGITNKDIMSGNKLRTLELLWRIFVVCYVPKFIQSHDVLINEIEQLKQNLTEHVLVRPIEKEISIETNLQLFSQKQTTPIISDIMKWAQLVCAHYRFWIKDLQESFSDGRALLFIIAYYLPNLINYQNDIKHYTTIGICQTKRDHIQFNDELRSTSGSTERLKRDAIKNVKSNFKLLEERTKQLPMFLSDLVKYEQYIATDIPDERVTIIILTLLARDLLFSNAQDINRNQQIFEQIKQQIQFDNDSDQLDDTDQQYQSSRTDNNEMKSPIENQKQLFATSNLEAERFIVNTPTQNMVNNSSLIGVKNEPVIPTYDTHIAEKCMEIADSSSTHKIVEQQQQIQTDEPIQTENCDEMNDASFSAGERSAAVDEDEDDDVVPPNESFINFISTTAISKSLKDPLNSSLAQFITEERSILDEETLMDDIQDLLQTMLSTMEIPDDHAIYITSSPTTHNLPDGGSSILQSSINNLTAAEMKFSNVAEEKTDLMDSNDYAEVSDVPVFMHKSTIVLDQSLTDDENDRICEMNATLENLVHEMQSRSLIEYDETDNDVDINIRTNHNQQQQQTSSQIEKFINRSQQINYYDENNNDEDIVAAAHLLLTLSKPQKRNNNTVLELPPCVYDKTLSDSLYASLETMFSNDTGLSQSIYTTMNQNILDRLGKSKTCSSDDDGDDDSEEEEDNDLYGTACSEQTNDGVATTTTTSSTSSLPFQDFVDIEKTATIDHEVANTHIHDDSKSTNSEMSEMNTIEEEHFGIDAQMIKDTLTNFLKYERNVVLPIVIRTDDSITNNNNVSNSAQANFNDDETVATIKVQSHWRGYKIRQRNEIEQHQIVKILDKIRSRSRSQSASLSTQKSLRDRTMDIVNAYNNSDTPCNILTVLRLLNDIEPIISVCIEIRFLIAQQGLLHLFYLFLRFCNRSEPSAALLTKILSVLKYFTVNKDLVMTLINKIDYINHYRTLLLKYYAADNMVFDQICDLLMAIIKHDNARQILSNSQMFNQTIEYVYKKLYKRAELEKQKQKQKQQQRSTPKTPRISCSMNMSMNSMFLTPIRKITVITVAQKNLKKYETFLRSFYAHK